MAGSAAGYEGAYHRQDARSEHRGSIVKRYLLDTNAAANVIFRRRGLPERVKAARLAGFDIGIGIPVLGELLGGSRIQQVARQQPPNPPPFPQVVPPLAVHSRSR